MQLTYDDIFKHSDMLNPISTRTLLLAGKLAEFGPEKTLLDLGSGKGFPSLLWASTFGIEIEGFELNRKYVKYANSYARLLNLTHLAKYKCRDIRRLKPSHRYDAVASLGIGITEVYGAARMALEKFRQMVRPGGFLILAEPAWLVKPVPKKLQKDLGTPEKNLCTEAEMKRTLEDCGFKVEGSFVSAKKDWELYIRPICVAMQKIMKDQPEVSNESQAIIKGFQAEYRAAGNYWDMILWVAKTH